MRGVKSLSHTLQSSTVLANYRHDYERTFIIEINWSGKRYTVELVGKYMCIRVQWVTKVSGAQNEDHRKIKVRHQPLFECFWYTSDPYAPILLCLTVRTCFSPQIYIRPIKLCDMDELKEGKIIISASIPRQHWGICKHRITQLSNHHIISYYTISSQQVYYSAVQ